MDAQTTYEAPVAYGPQPVFVYLTENGKQRDRYTACTMGALSVVAKGPTSQNAIRVVMSVLKKTAGAPKKQKADRIDVKDWRELEKIWRQQFLPLL